VDLVGVLVAAVALLGVLVLALRVRALRAAQRVVVGEGGERDLVAHARDLERELSALSERVDGLAAGLEATGGRVEGAITHAAVVRYDAHGEISGRQSSSIALLDDRRDGVVLSSILHREQARLYAKPLVAGRSEIGLSPEEEDAISQAMAGGGRGG
jgi:Protein of unknown function (DUF4446)